MGIKVLLSVHDSVEPLRRSDKVYLRLRTEHVYSSERLTQLQTLTHLEPHYEGLLSA